MEFTCLVPPAQVHNLPVLFELIFKSVQNDSEVRMCACVVTSLQWEGSFGRYIIAHVLALIKANLTINQHFCTHKQTVMLQGSDAIQCIQANQRLKRWSYSNLDLGY